MIAVLDIFELSPDFKNAVVSVHNATLPVALVICFWGLTLCIMQAHQVRSVSAILPALIQITIVSLIVSNMTTLGNWLEQVVLDIEQTAGVGNGSAFTAYTAAIKTKFGVDVSVLNNLMPASPGQTAGITLNGTMLTHYAYPNDSTGDSKSSQGIGAFAPFLTAGSLIAYQNPQTPASAGLSADMAAKYNVQPGQAFQVTSSSGVTYNLIYSDTGADWETGRIDIYDPNNALGGNNNFGGPITNFTLGAPMSDASAQTAQPGNNLLNALLHPGEAAAAASSGC